ncbi:MAG: HAD family hydrolase [Acutalibacteraceae bacterium]|nr:HAD family hydrolase [Acutalibacteraceae bacterium]
MIKAVLFDLDGTLVNTLGDLSFSVNYVLKKHGYPVHEAEKFKKFIGNGNEAMVRRALPEEKRNHREYVLKLRDEFYEYYKKHCADKSCLYDGIEELVVALKKMDISIAIVTNKAQIMTDVLVPQLFGENVFSAIIGQRDGVPTKPEPHMPFLAMTEMDVNPDECLFVGDSSVDIETGLNCGNTPVGVLWGFRDEKELRDAGARYIVETPEKIIDIIREINEC